MHQDELRQHLQQSSIEWAFVWFMRLLALSVLVRGVYYWVRLIGVYPGLLWRFDLMPWMWQSAIVTLALLMPVAATGLWMRAPWGTVLWIVAALGEVCLYLVFSSFFEYRPLLAVLNIACILAYIAFRVLLFVEHKQQLRKMELVVQS